jgi:hypothetical protein
VFWMPYAFFWVINRRLKFKYQHFGTPHPFQLHTLRWNRQSVLERWYINFRHWWITQKQAYNSSKMSPDRTASQARRHYSSLMLLWELKSWQLYLCYGS